MAVDVVGVGVVVVEGSELEIRFALRPRILALVAAIKSKSLPRASGAVTSFSALVVVRVAVSSSGLVKNNSVPICSAQEQLKTWFWYETMGFKVWRPKIWRRSCAVALALALALAPACLASDSVVSRGREKSASASASASGSLLLGADALALRRRGGRMGPWREVRSKLR